MPVPPSYIEATMASRIFIVEDHPVVREGFVRMIERAAGLELAGQAANAAEALDRIGAAEADLALIDVALPGMSGVELIKHLQAHHPEVLLLVISSHDEVLYAERVMRSGARGYVMKSESVEVLVQAIYEVLEGRRFVSKTMQSRMLRQFVGKDEDESSPIERLSDRELEVFRHIGTGLATREIAETMDISIKTVETYRANIKQKLDLDDAYQLMRHAVVWVEGALDG